MKKQVLLIVSFLSFIALGLPDGMLGVAWPSMSATFGIPLGSLGVLMAGFTVGYVVTTALIGSLIHHFGYAMVMIASAASLAVGGALLAGAPWLPVAMAATIFLGIGSGLLDGGLNAYGATYFRPRDLNWLHAFYGIGAALGPAIMTPMILSGPGWRGGYVVLVAVASGTLALFVLTRRSWADQPAREARKAAQKTAVGENTVGAERNAPENTDGAPDETTTVPRSKIRLRLIAVGSVAIFFLYTGLEVVAGQWAFSLFTINRGISAARAGTWVGIYWTALTVGRILFGWVSEHLPVPVVLRGALIGVGLGIVLLIPTGMALLAPVGLATLGFSLAPIFPLLIGETPRRIGARRANHLIGFQIAAANIGAVSIVAAVGLAVETIGLEVVPWSLLITFSVFIILHEALVLLSRP